MPAVFKIDGWDAYPFVRVQEGDGLDPADPDMIEHRFSDSGLGDGDQLISVHAGNRELVLPLLLTPVKDGLPATRDGLHQQVTALHNRLRNARTLEWRDDGATQSTYLTIVAARFEAAYDYRLAGNLYLKGTLRVWCRPYGTTGTSRIAGTAAGTGVTVTVPLGSLAGDAPAILDVLVRVGSQPFEPPVEARLTGAAVVPTAYAAYHPAASLVQLADAQLVVASGAAGSQAIRRYVNDDVFGYTTNGEQPFVRLTLPGNATVYEGRNRVLAVANHEHFPGVLLRAYDRSTGQPLETGDVALATVPNGKGWGAADLGVITVDPAGTPTVVIDVTGEWPGNDKRGWLNNRHVEWLSARHEARIACLTVLPDDSTTLVRDTDARTLAWDNFTGHSNNMAPGIDQLGNRYMSATAIGATDMLLVLQIPQSDLYRIVPTSGLRVAGAIVAHPTAADMRVEAVTLQGISQGFVQVGKHVGGTLGFHLRTSYSGWGALYAGATLLASVAIPAAGDLEFLSLELRTVGPAITGVVREMASGMYRPVGTLAASHQHAARAGLAAFAAQASEIAGAWFDSVRVTALPSTPLNPRDMIVLSGASSSTVKLTSASVPVAQLTTKTVGGYPQADPNMPVKVVAFNLPADGGVSNDLLNAEVRVTERWTYAR